MKWKQIKPGAIFDSNPKFKLPTKGYNCKVDKIWRSEDMIPRYFIIKTKTTDPDWEESCYNFVILRTDDYMNVYLETIKNFNSLKAVKTYWKLVYES